LRISSLTFALYPAAKTSKPRSRSANVNSSAISGVSSMSRMRRNRTLLLAGPCTREALLLAGGRLQIQDPDSASGRVIGPMVVLDHRAPGFECAHREGVSLKIIACVVQYLTRMPVVGEDGVTWVHAQNRVV